VEEEKSQKKKGPEKPLNLWGASYSDVLRALLKTKPMPKEKGKRVKENAERK